MKWTKKGRIYTTDNLSEWQFSHTYCPTPILLEDRIRIYVTFWDKNKRGRPGYIDVTIDNPLEIIGISTTPCLGLGSPGTFDEDGRTCMSVVKVRSDLYLMLYVGWQRQVTVPYTLFTGIAYSRDGKTFNTISQTPYLDRTPGSPFSRAGASFMVGDDTVPPSYIIYFEALKWDYFTKYNRYWFDGRITLRCRYGTRDIAIILTRRNGDWCFGRPWLIRKNGKLHLWYVYKQEDPTIYLQGYGITDDILDTDPHILYFDSPKTPVLELGASEDFDSKAASHATVLEVNPNKYYLFYMGNEYGKAGFGYAETESLDDCTI